MRATLKRYFDALIARREEGKDKGFSLIELIVVVAILGILVAIAIPVFGNIQQTAKENAIATIAANGATQVATAVATSATALTTVSLTNLSTTDTTVTISKPTTGNLTLGNFCVSATAGSVTKTSGPGC